MAHFSTYELLEREILCWLRSPSSYNDQRVDQIHGFLLSQGSWRVLWTGHVHAACARLATANVITHKRSDCYAMTSAQLAMAARAKANDVGGWVIVSPKREPNC